MMKASLNCVMQDICRKLCEEIISEVAYKSLMFLKIAYYLDVKKRSSINRERLTNIAER